MMKGVPGRPQAKKPQGEGKPHPVEEPISRLPDRMYYIECQGSSSQTWKRRDIGLE